MMESKWFDIDGRDTKVILIPMPNGYEFDTVSTSRMSLVFDPATGVPVLNMGDKDSPVLRVAIKKV